MIIKSTDKIEKTGFDAIVIASDTENIGKIKERYSEVGEYIDTECFDGVKARRFSVTKVVEGKKKKYILISLCGCLTSEDILDIFGKAAKEFSSEKARKVLVDASLAESLKDDEKAVAGMKGLAHGSYSFNKFFTDKKAEEPEKIKIYSDGIIEDNIIEKANAINESIRLAKYMVDEPANIMTPEEIAKTAEKSLKGTDVKVKIYEKEEIENLGMTLFMNVAKGSKHKPRLIVMKYFGNKDSKEITALIGKGLAYDTGGYSIKTNKGMKDMKCDMGGAASVIGAMNLIAYEKPAVNVIGVVATCENRISGNSYLPGDILTSMNGKTVEIENTDAEGRLTLADAMTYAIRKEGATKVVDICTLTGACVAALGEEYAGVVTKCDELWAKTEEVSKKSLDPCWRLPLNKRIEDFNRSKVADLKNSGGQPGCETAAAFVGEFSEGLPWIHFDIAGTAMVEKEKDYLRAGATGFGVHLLSELVKVL